MFHWYFYSGLLNTEIWISAEYALLDMTESTKTIQDQQSTDKTCKQRRLFICLLYWLNSISSLHANTVFWSNIHLQEEEEEQMLGRLTLKTRKKEKQICVYSPVTLTIGQCHHNSYVHVKLTIQMIIMQSSKISHKQHPRRHQH